MRKFFNGLLIGIVLGAAGYWFVQKRVGELPDARQSFEQSAAQLRTNAESAAHNLSDAMQARLDALDLQTGQIQDELAKDGQVVRRKAEDIGEQAVNAASDVRAVAEIKAKYVADPALSVWDISVACDQGHVKLSGKVSAPEDIGKAVALALEADGVRDVTSTLQVIPRK